MALDKQIPKVLFYNVIVLLEIIFGNWFGSDRLNRLNIIKNASLYYDIEGLYPSENNTIHYIRDEYGFRGNYTSVNSIDILTIGGSTTDQRYITEGQTWQDVLAREFLATGKKVSVVNAGVDGQSTVGHIKNFDWWFPLIPNLNAKYILLYVGINDFFTLGSRYDALIYDEEVFENIVKNYSLHSRIIDNSALYHLYRTIRGIREVDLLPIVGHGSVDYSSVEWVSSEPNIQNHRELMQDRIISYRNRLTLLGEKIGEMQAVPICVAQYAHVC